MQVSRAARDKRGQVRDYVSTTGNKGQLAQNREANRQRREANRQRRQAGRHCEPERTSMPVVQDEWVQGKLGTFHAKMSSLSLCHCSCCNESFPGIKLTSGGSVCSRCSRDKQEPKLYSAANNIHPGSVPPALQGLTQAEEMLISPVMPIMSVYNFL